MTLGFTATCVSLTAVLIAFSGASAQVQKVGAALRFEVASIRSNLAPLTIESMQKGHGYPRPKGGGRLDAVNTTLETLIRYAYGLQPYQILEGDKQALYQRFDVLAKAPYEVESAKEGAVGPLNIMVQNLLAERFALVVRWENRERTAYVLVRARRDGTFGPQLKESSAQCAAAKTLEARYRACGNPALQGRLRLSGVSMSSFAVTLTGLMQTPVIDQTELSGVYDLAVTFNSSTFSQPTSQFDHSPSLFAALEEQLGLKLHSSRMPIPVLIVDKIGALVEN